MEVKRLTVIAIETGEARYYLMQEIDGELKPVSLDHEAVTNEDLAWYFHENTRHNFYLQSRLAFPPTKSSHE